MISTTFTRSIIKSSKPSLMLKLKTILANDNLKKRDLTNKGFSLHSKESHMLKIMRQESIVKNRDHKINKIYGDLQNTMPK